MPRSSASSNEEVLIMAGLPSDIRIRSLTPHYPFVRARTPLKFGAVIVEALDFCHVRAEVETRSGKVAEGWGAMFLMDMWAWPTAKVAHEQRMIAMRTLNGNLCKLFASYDDYAHPIDIFHRLEGGIQRAGEALSREMKLAEQIPFLAALVCASPIDAALHDAFGNANAIDTYAGYGRDFMAGDLSTYLGNAFKGAYVGDFVKKSLPKLFPCFHLVGGLDKLRPSEITAEDPIDGLPVSLDQWIRYDHLHCLKVKLRGTDMAWDLNRTFEVAAIAREEHKKLGLTGLFFNVDTNDQCKSPDYVIEYLSKVREKDKPLYDEILYFEQPINRDLRAHRFDMRPASKLKPMLADESLMTLEDFDLAMELGWSGVVLKACKCQSDALVFACRAEKQKIPYTVQDLTNPGIALIQSVGLAGHLNTIKGVEANSRQFFPAASIPEERVHRGLFRLTDGHIDTSSIRGAGLGYRWEEIGRTMIA
jgi:L-alanine-DL-glutamate epimerase-like enolase superfamily enzyme